MASAVSKDGVVPKPRTRLHKVVERRNSLQLCWNIVSSGCRAQKLSHRQGAVRIVIKFDPGDRVDCPFHEEDQWCCSPTIDIEKWSMPRSGAQLTSARFLLVADCADLSEPIAQGKMPTVVDAIRDVGECVVPLSNSRDEFNVHFHLVVEASGLFNVCDGVTLRNHAVSQFSDMFNDSDHSDVTVISGDGEDAISVRYWGRFR